MSKLPDAAQLPAAPLHVSPCPEGTSLHLEGQSLCVASPVDFTEACFCVPALRALMHFKPQSTIAILCPESQQALWQVMPELNHVISYRDDASARQIQGLLADFEPKFESAVIWEAGKAARALAHAGVTQRLGYPASGLEKLLTDVVSVANAPGPIEHRVRHYLNFVEKLGADGFVKANFLKPPMSAAPEKLRIVIAPLSEYGSAYQWPVERFKEVMDVMDSRYSGIEWIILGGGSVEQKSDARVELEAMSPGRVKNDAKDLDQARVLETLKKSTALLACDGELAHVAAHVGLPAAVVFGPNEPEWRRPLGAQSLVIREHVACSPCYLAKCPLDHRCQLQVSVEMVVASLEDAIKLRQEQ